MTHRAQSNTESHTRCPTPGDCVCGCPTCIEARFEHIKRQRLRRLTRDVRRTLEN